MSKINLGKSVKGPIESIQWPIRDFINEKFDYNFVYKSVFDFIWDSIYDIVDDGAINSILGDSILL